MKIAIKVGGSVFCPVDKPDPEFVHRLAGTLLRLSAKHRLLVIVGGGKLARRMIQEAKEKTRSADELHSLGIQAARMNASVLMHQLGKNVFQGIPKNAEEVKLAFSQSKIVVVGGFRPGQTTDAVTVQSAEAMDADLIIIGTDVKGVYDKDPKKHANAKFIREIAAAELREMVEHDVIEPGKNTILDPVAAQLIEKTGTKTIVLNIRYMDNLINAIEGREFAGTLVG